MCFELINYLRFCAKCVRTPNYTVIDGLGKTVPIWNLVHSMTARRDVREWWQLQVCGFLEVELEKNKEGILQIPWWAKLCVMGRQYAQPKEEKGRTIIIFQIFEYLGQQEKEAWDGKDLKKRENDCDYRSVWIGFHRWTDFFLKAHAVAVQWKGGRMLKQTLEWFLKTALRQPKTIERVNLSWTALRVFVEKDGDRDECRLHNNPRKQCNLSNWDMRKFTEITFYKRSRNILDVYREKTFTSKHIGIVYMECAVDRLPVDGRFTRECDEETSREGVVFPDLIDQELSGPLGGLSDPPRGPRDGLKLI